MATELKFRNLFADEIDIRVAQSGKTDDRAWASLLCYKDARVDQRLLDEVVGPMNWQRKHSLIGDRLYCSVGIYCNERKEWIWKEDVGTESNTEPEKGQASDAFKRACFNWGIGRSLYSAPSIFINLNKEDYSEVQGKLRIKTKFYVGGIAYDVNGNICFISITDRDGRERFRWGRVAEDTAPETVAPEKKTAKSKSKAAAPAPSVVQDTPDAPAEVLKEVAEAKDMEALRTVTEKYKPTYGKSGSAFNKAVNKRYTELMAA